MQIARASLLGLALLTAACMPERPLELTYFGGPMPGPAPAQMKGDLWLPPGEERVPLVVLTHDTRGYRRDQIKPWVDMLRGMGAAVAVLDHYTPRGIDGEKPPQERPFVSSGDFLMDVHGAIAVLAEHPRIDRRRIGVIGFGEGGGSAALASAHASVERNRPAGSPPIRLHVAVYPECGFRFGNRATTRVPVRMILAQRDGVTGTSACTDLADYLRAAGANIRVSTYPDGRHGFDDPPGAAKRDPQGENISACVWQEGGDGTWRERRSGVSGATLFRRNETEQGLAAYQRGRAGCRTLGTETAGNPDLRQRAQGEVAGYVREFLFAPIRPGART